MRRFLWPSVIALLAIAGAFARFWIWPPPPSILLITIDTLRADRLGAYGHPSNKTPNIDRLASEGMVYERAYCDMPWTTGSMASVMTGRYSNEHGLRDPSSKIDPKVTTLAERLHGLGFQTGAIVGSFPLDSVYGLNKGFETYNDEFTMAALYDPAAPVKHVGEALPESFADQAEFIQKKQENDWYRPDESVTDTAIDWLESMRDGRPYFLWVHYFGPHEKLDRTRSEFAQESEIIEKYDGDVERTDIAVGRLLEHLRSLHLIDKTLIILHADHGQNLGENDYVGHTVRLDEASIHIPMILRYPQWIPAGTRSSSIARNIDIFATALATRGLVPGDRPGVSLLPATENTPVPTRRPDTLAAYFETFIPLYFLWPQTQMPMGTTLGPMVSRGARAGNWKLVVNEYRGPCDWGASPTRDGTGTWRLSDVRRLTAERCAQIGAKDLLTDSPSSPDGVMKVDEPKPLVFGKLDHEIHLHDDVQEKPVGEKFELDKRQEEKLKSLGYLR